MQTPTRLHYPRLRAWVKRKKTNGKRIVERKKGRKAEGKGRKELEEDKKKKGKKRNAGQGLRGGEKKKKRREKKSKKKKLFTELNLGPTDERTPRPVMC